MRKQLAKLFVLTQLVAVLAGVQAAFGYETPIDARYPYVSTYYVEPVVSPASNTTIRFFVTDWENSLERFADDSFRFDAHLRYTTNRVDWTELSLTDIPSGDHAIELGQLPRGDYIFGLHVVDRSSGLPSHTVWHEFRSRTAEELEVPADCIYTMTEADLATYGIVPETNRYTYIEVPVDSETAADIASTSNYVAGVAAAAEVPSGTYAIFSPVSNGKPLLKAFRRSACKYAADYDFAAVENEASNNVVAIQRFIDAVAEAGYRRLVFLPGKYRISYLASLEMRAGLDVDLNGATLKGNGFTGASGCLVNFTHIHDGALRNGTIEGDYYEHDYAGSTDNSEWPLGVCLHGDCRYVTLDGLVVTNITGYGVSNGTRAYDHTFPGRAYFNGNGCYSAGCLRLADGTVDTSAANRFTSVFRDISSFTNGYVTVSKYLGYQGIATKSWNYIACFYDADKTFISGEVAFQYREVLIPPGAKYMRITVEEETADAANGCSMSAQLFKRPWNCAFRNLFIYRCRCVGMAQSAMRNMLVEKCEFSFSGESSATCAYDAEDGWDMMQDVFIRDNYFHDNNNAELLTCAGHNFVMERNRAKLHLYARTNSPCVRDNICPSATLECGTRNRTMHGRYHGNFFEKSLNFGNNTTETNWFINLAETIGPEIPTAGYDSFSLSVSRTGHYRGATIRHAKMQPGSTFFDQTVFTNCHLVLSGTKDGNWTDCVFKDCYCQYSLTNVFTRCVFTDGTHVSMMTGRGSTTLIDCVFTNFYLESGYWTTPYDLTMKRCSVRNRITQPFWSAGVYSIGNFSISDSVFDTDGVAPFHIFDLRAQDTDSEPAAVTIAKSEISTGQFVSKASGVKSTTKHVAFTSMENIAGGEPVETADAFMCPLLPDIWTCNFLEAPGELYTYTGPDGGDWYEPSNWDRGAVPQARDSVLIPQGRVYIPQAAACSNLTVGAEGALFLGSTGTVTAACTAFPGADVRHSLSLNVSGDLASSGQMAIGGRWFLGADSVVTNLSVTVGGDFTLADGAVCAVYANTTDKPITWPELWAAAARFDVAGDIRVSGGSVLYPTADRLTGATIRFRCHDFALDATSSVNAQNRGWGWITYTAAAEIDPRKSKSGSYDGASRFTLAPNSLDVGEWETGATYAFTNRFAPFAPGTQSAAYHTPSDGGGQFTLWASGTATVGGVIRADGVHNVYSGNSGGGIWLAANRFDVGRGAKLIATGGKNTHGSGTAGGGGSVSIAIGLSEEELEGLASGAAPADLGLASLAEINEIPCDVSGGLNGDQNTCGPTGTATMVFGASDHIYLKADATGMRTGTSWADAYTDLDAAVDAALLSGKPIHAAGGIYIFPAVRELTSTLTIYGGFPGVDDAETLADRDATRYETVFTGDQALDDVWQHCVTNTSYGLTQTALSDKPIISNGKLNLPPAFTEDFDTYAPSRKNTNTAGAFMVLAGGALTVDGLTFSGFYNSNSNGPSKSGDNACAVLMFVAGSMNVSNCRFIGNACGQGSIYTKQDMTVADCDFLYNLGVSRGCGVTQHAKSTTLRRCRFVSIVRTGDTSSQVVSCWSGNGFDLFDCEFARCVQAMGTGFNGNYGGPSNVFGGEGGGRGNFQDCVISNCYTATSNAKGPQMMGGRGYWHMNRCVVANNLGVCKPTADKAFCLIGQACDTGKNRRVYESTTFVGNEMRAQDVAAASGSYALGILGNNVAGSDTLFLNCTFDGNRAAAPDKANVTKVLCRGVVTFAATAASTAQTGLANCTFTGPHEEGVYDVAQFGAGHTKDINLVNCVFDAGTDGMTDPVYADVPNLIHFVNTSVLNCLTPNPGMNYEGLAYDKVPLVRTVADAATGRYVYLPGAKVPYIYDTCDVATNHTSFPMSWVFRRPGSTDWVALASNTGKNGSGWDGKLVTDATDAARPAGAFTRGAVQALTAAAENGKSLVLRRDPFAAGSFEGPASQAAATGDSIVPVTASSTDTGIYTFDGWYDAGGNKVSSSATLGDVTFTDDDCLVLTAKFAVPDVTLTFDLGGCGTFVENGQATISISAKPGSVFPAVPAYTVGPEWHCLGFTLPQTVPTAAASYSAEYVTTAVRRIYVTPDGTGDGSSWANAYGDLAAAYADAAKYRGEVWVKAGFYTLDGFIPMKSNVAVLGGFAGDETEASAADPASNLSVISGDRNDDDYWQPNGSGGSLAANKIWRDGVYNAPNPDGARNYDKASGNVSDNLDSAFVASGVATNCAFDGIVLTGFRNGAVLATGGQTEGLAFRRCSFLGDNAYAPGDTAQGGTVRLIGSALFEDCLFDGCVYPVSGIASTAGQTITVRRCTFSNNYAGSYRAGGIRLQSDMGLDLAESRFYRNYNDSRGYQAGSSLAFYSSVGKVAVTDCVFEEELNKGDSHGPVVFQGGSSAGAYEFTRCRFLGNRRSGENNNNYENGVSSCLSTLADATVLLRDCYFEGNEMRLTNANCTDDYRWGSVLAGYSGAYTFVNCTFLDNLAESVRDDKSVGTIVVGGASVALVGCVFKDSVLTGPTVRKADLLAADSATLGIVNTVLASSSEGYVALRSENASWVPTIANSFVQGFDATAFEPLAANGYLHGVVTNGDPQVKEAVEEGENGAVALRVRSGCPAKARPVWLVGTTVYFYDDVADAAKPWRKAIDRSSYAATVSGLDLATPYIPDAFGTERRKSTLVCGPLSAPPRGSCVIIR